MTWTRTDFTKTKLTLAHSFINVAKSVTSFNEIGKSMTDIQFQEHIENMAHNDLLAIAWHKEHKAKRSAAAVSRVKGGHTVSDTMVDNTTNTGWFLSLSKRYC